MNYLRAFRRSIGTMMIVLMLSLQIGQPLQAATFYWDADTTATGNSSTTGAGLGGAGTWNTSLLNWWDGSAASDQAWNNGGNDTAIFWGPTGGIVTLDAGGITAGALQFKTGYTLSGGPLSLSTGTVTVDGGSYVTIASQLNGTSGLTLNSTPVAQGGALKLTNAANGYTGTTTINAGTLVIGSSGALGSDTSTVVINGAPSPGSPGGSLMLAGSTSAASYGTGFTLSRNLSLFGGSGGGGVTTAVVNGVGLVSVGNNTISGQLNAAPATGAPNGGLTSAFGMLTLSNVAIGGSGTSNYTTFGSLGSIGNYSITGVLSGAGSIQKAGGGTLILNPSDSSGYSGTIRITRGSVRLTSASSLGTNAGTGTSSTINLNNDSAILEVRSDSFTSTKNIYQSSAASPTMYIDHAVGSSSINTTTTFGSLGYAVGETLTFSGRNGVGLTFSTAPVTSADGNDAFTNNLNGTLTFTGNFWSTTENSAAHTMTIGGSGNTLISGNILATSVAFDHVLTKTGTGTLTLTGTGTSLDGAVNINQGTLAITDFSAINVSSTSVINIGSAANAGTLNFITSNSTAAQLTSGTSRAIALNGTTGGAIINANQTDTDPVLFNSTAAIVSGAGVKTLTLGGTNTSNNEIKGIIQDNSVTNITSLTKTDAGTWLLSGANTYTGATTISGGTLKLQSNAATTSTIVANTSNVVFDVNATTLAAGGTLQFIGFTTNNATTETFGTLVATAGAGTITTTLGTGGAAALANISFTALGTVATGTGINFVTGTANANGSVTIGSSGTSTATTLPGNGHFYINGSDFARASGNVMVTPSYGVDSGFNAINTITAATHTAINTTTTTTAGATLTLSSVKIMGNSTAFTLATGQTLTISTGGILATGATGASITGGTGITTGGTGDMVIRVDGTNDKLTLSTPITATTTGGLTKNGAGTLIINTTNAQIGGLTINEGTVQLLSGTIGGTATSATTGTLNIRQGASLDLNGITMSNTPIAQFNGAGTIKNTSATAATITVGTSNGTGTFSGIIDQTAGVINITKAGTGAQTWSGLSTYTGVTTIGSTGIVSVATLANLGAASGIGKGNSSGANQAAIDANNSASLVFNGTTGGIAYTGTTSVSIDRLFTMSGGGQISNNSANNSTLIFNKTNAIVFGTTASQTLTLGGSSTGDNMLNLKLTNPSAGTLGLSKIGAGLWILGNAANDNTGTTQIGLTSTAGGVLQAIDGSSLSNNSYLLIGGTTGGGVFQSSGNFTRNIGTTSAVNTVTFNSTLTTGAVGFAASDSKLTVSLGGLVSPTALTWGSGGFMGTSGTSTGAFVLNTVYSLAEIEVRNAINLNGVNRTIQVDDNLGTFTDFATISGVLSNSTGTAGIIKTGTSILQLLGANTYNGSTTVQAGTLVVNSLGLSTVAGGTSVGAATGGNTLAQAVILGNTTTTAGTLIYVGAGETSDRYILFNGTTAGPVIVADGTGPLVLTNVNNNTALTPTGAKTLTLRGSNTLGNTISSNLANDGGGGVLSVTHDSGGTWILSGNNTYTGATNVTAGALGAGSDTAFGSGGTLTINNSAVFAAGGDRTLSNPVTQTASSGTIAAFYGDYSLTFTGLWSDPSSTSTGRIIRNDIVSGKVLNIAGEYRATAGTSSRFITFDGSGDTLLSGAFTVLTNANFGLVYAGTGSLTLGNSGNSYTGTTTVSSGSIKLGDNNVIPNAIVNPANNVVVINPAAGVTATLDLNGYNETINGLTANSAGNAVINNSSTSAASLTFGANDQTVVIAPASGGSFTVSNTGGGALSITKTGTTSLTIPSTGVTLSYTGTTAVTGGTLTVAAVLNGTSGLSSTGTGSALNVIGGLTVPGAITSVTVGGGSFLRLLDGTGTPLSNLTSLNLGAGSGIATLSLELGTLSDTLTVSSAATVANTILLNLSGISGLLDATDYNLLVAPSGLSTGTYQLGSQPGGFSSGFLTVTDSLVKYTTGTAIVGNLIWNNTQATGSWATNNAGATNFTTDLAGTTDGGFTPGPGTTVIFGTTALTGGPAFTTTLDSNFTVAGLQFTANPSGVTSWVINAGTPTTSNLTIKASGIDVGNNAGAVTINANVILGAAQSWNVNGSGANGSSLTIAGIVSGNGFALSKTGAGILNLSGINTFNGGLAIKAGTVIGTVTTSAFGPGTITLGNTSGSSSAALQVNTTGLTYANAIALAAGGTGTLTIGTPVNAAAVAVTFSGGVTGTNNLTINNQSLSGTTTFSVNALNNVGSITNISSSTGAVIISGGIGSNVTNVTQNSATSALTLSVANLFTGTVNLTLGTLNVNNANALGATGAGGLFTIAGGTVLNNSVAATPIVNLANNAVKIDGDFTFTGTSSLNLGTGAVSLGTAAGTTRTITSNANTLTLGGVISNGTTANSISKAGAGTLTLLGANTFTGGVTVTAGTLEFATVSNNGGAASSLGQGSDGITLGGGTLSFVGSTNQTTNRGITLTSASTLTASGTGGATFTYLGAINGAGISLTLDGTGTGIFNSAFTQTGPNTTSDITKNGTGTWTLLSTIAIADDLLVNAGTLNLNVAQSVTDDFVIAGATTVVNLNAAAAFTGDDLYVRGSLLKLGVNGALTSGMDDLNVSVDTASGSILDIAGTTGSAPTDIFLGNVGFTGSIIDSVGGGSIGGAFGFRAGTVSANLTGAGTMTKTTAGTVTLSGANTGYTGAAVLTEGTLVLDYTTNNGEKLSNTSAGSITGNGGTAIFNGNASAATVETLGGLTVNAGATHIFLNNGSGQTATLNFSGAATRTVVGGTVDFVMSSASATIQTAAPNVSGQGILGGYATVSGNRFATVSGGLIQGLNSTVKNSLGTWVLADNVTDSTGYTGSVNDMNISSLRFDAAGATSTVTVNSGFRLNITSGGILVTSNVGAGNASITGGALMSGNGLDLIVLQNNTTSNFTIASNIGSLGVTKSGAGTLVLSGFNNYTGQTTLNEGTLKVAGGNAIGDTSAVVIKNAPGAVLDLNGSNETIGTLSGGGVDGGTVAIGTGRLTVNQAANGTFAGLITGSGALIKTGTATLTINGTANTFSGDLIINQGQISLTDRTDANFSNISTLTLNTGVLLLDFTGGTEAAPNKINNSATVTLINTGGIDGLRANNDRNDASKAETVGAMTLLGGANTITLQESASVGTTARQMTITAASLTRSNRATLLVRGNNLGDTAAGGVINSGRFVSTAAPSGVDFVGGGGAFGSTTISIVPWVIGDSTATSSTAHGNGSSFVTYAATTGFRPLTTSEYEQLGAAGGVTAANNVRYSSSSDLTLNTATARTMNALLIENTSGSAGITLAGAGASLNVASGAFLFLGSQAINVSGFSTITTTGGLNEYILHVVNTASGTGVTVGSAFTTSGAALTKSGAGTLTLTSTGSTYTGPTTINQGVLQIDSLANLGNNGSGGIVINGGTLRFGTAFDASAVSLTFGVPATTNVVTTTGATFETNFDVTFANAIGGGGNGGFTKTGTGKLTLQAGATYTGNTTVADGKIVLNGGGNNRLPNSGLTLGSGTTSGVLQLGDGTNGASNLAVTSLATSGTGTSNAIVGGGAAASVLTVTQTATTTYAGSIGGAGPNENNLGIVKAGLGVLTLSGATLTYTGTTTVSAGTLNITGSTGAALTTSGITVAAGGTLNLLNGVGQTLNMGAGTLNLGAGTGAASLGLEMGSTSAYDSLSITGAATTANTVVLNLTGLTGFGAGNYDLLTAASGLSNATFTLGTFSGALNGVTLNLTSSDTLVRLVATASTGNFYWRGAVSNSWMGNNSQTTNFTTDLAGTINANGTPGAASTVIFSAQNASGPVISTTLDSNFTVNDLKFTSNPSGVTAVTIAAGTPTTSSLTIAPSVSTVGIDVASNAGAITISAPLVLGAAQTWNIAGTGANGSSLLVSGGITGAGPLTINTLGTGTITMSGTNTYTGSTTVSGGVLQQGTANGFSALSAYVINGSGILRLNNLAGAIGSLAGTGTVEIGSSATAARTLTTGGDNTSTTFSGVIQDGGGFALSLAKIGNGTLTLSGANIYTGNTTVNGGALSITGSWTGSTGLTGSVLLYGETAATTVVNVSGNISVASTMGGRVAGSVSVYNQTAGTVTNTRGADDGSNTATGVALAGYGYFNLTGGSYEIPTNRFSVTAGTGTGVAYIGGTGVLNHTSGSYFMVGGYGGGKGSTTIGPGGSVIHDGATQVIAINWTTTGSYGALNLAGGSLSTTTQAVRFGGGAAASSQTGFFNIAGGTFSTGVGITSTNTSGTGNNYYINLAGGTIKTTAAVANMLPVTYGFGTITINNFGAIDNSALAGAPSFDGGLVFDTNGFNSGILAPMLAAAGNGIAQSSLSVTGGSGYVGAPLVQFTGGTLAPGGSPASGYALISGGAVVGIVITSPGNYTSAPTVTLTGGGGTGSSVTVGTLVANTSGGLTKNGAGTLTLSGANTYTGGTFVNAGTLALGASNVLADAGNVSVNGGIFDIATFSDTVATVTLQSGSITGSTGVLTATGSYELQSGTASAILSGSAGVNKTTSGTATLSAANTYSGAVNVTGGTLAFAAGNNLGNASATNTVTVNGGTLSYTGSTSVDLGANRVLTVGAAGGTLNVSNSLGVLTFSGGVNAASTGNLIKTGAGTVVLSGTTNLNGGTVSVNNGTLRAGFGTSGISALTIGATGVMNFSNGSAQALAGLAGLTLNGGARAGFELNGLANDSLAATGAATTSGTITLDFFATGSGVSATTYNLISAASGLSGATYVLGAGVSGWNLVINSTDTLVSVTATPFVPVYWRGGQNFSWNTLGAATANWTTDAAGLVDATQTPQSNNTVIFSAAGAPFTSGTQITSTLDAAFTIDSLVFDSVPAGITAVTINPGTGGTLALVPVSSSAGIEVRDNGGTVTIAAPLTAGAAGGAPSQTWSVSNVGASLIVTGSTVFTDTVVKTGAGALTLSGSNSGAGGVSLSAGTLNINSTSALGTGTFTIGAGSIINNSTAGAIILAANNAQIWNGSFTFTGTQSLNLGTGAVTMVNHTTITVNGQTLTVGGVISEGTSNRILSKAGTGTLVLSGNNTFAGGFSLLGGTLNINNAGALGTGLFTIEAGTTINNITGSALALSANNAQLWNGSYTFTGSSSLNLGTGNVTLGSNVSVTTTASTLTVGGVIDDGVSTFGLTKLGAGTLSLGGSNTYGGATILNQGALIFTANQNLTAVTNTLTLGETAGSTSAFSMNLSTASATFGGAALVQTNNSIANTITIGAGQALTLGSSFTVGYNSAGNTTTYLSITGANGSFNIGGVGAPTNANVQIGNGATSNISNAGILDMSGLGTFYANLGTGSFRVGSLTNGSGAAAAGSTVILAANSTIIATTITSDSPDSASVTQAIKLGSGTNVFNATTITIGAAAAGSRARGTLDFNGATGTIQIRNLAGTGRAAMNVQNGAATTTSSLSGAVDFTGHSADLLLSTLAIGGRSAGTTGSGTGAFSFDTGTLDATTINLAARTGSTMTSGGVTGTLTLGGGTVTVGTLTMSTNSVTTNNAAASGDTTSTLNISGTGTNNITTLTMGTLSVTNTTALSSDSSDTTATVNVSGGTTSIGTLTMGVNNSAATTVSANTATASLNISAGAVTVTNNLTMGQTTLRSGNTATATITITGGSLTVGGNIVYTDGLGTENNTVTLNGGLLDLTVGSIGSASALVAFNAQAGTLRNLSELNGGGTLTKTTTGTLTFDTANTYTGATVVSAGILAISNGGALGGTTNGTSVTAGGTLSMSGDITVTGESLSIAAGAGGNAALNNQSGNNTWTGNLTVDTGADATNRAVLNSDAGKLTVSGNVSLSGAQDFVLRGDGDGEVSGQITGSQRLFKSSVGTGTWIISGNNSSTFTGKTSVGNGALQISSESNLGATPGTFVSNQLTLGSASTNGRLKTTGTMALSANRGVTVAAGGGTFETAASTTLTVNSVITGTGTLTKEGSGSLIFTGVNTNTGLTTVNAGVLGGTGAVGGDLTVASSGTLAPGIAAGQFTVAGNLAVSSGGTLLMQLGGATTNDAAAVRAYLDGHGGSLTGLTIQSSYENYVVNTTAHDSILINGAAAPTINGTLKLDALIGGYVPVYGDIFDLLDWTAVGSITGTPSFDFNSVSLGAGLGWNTDLFASNGILVVVPEPSRVLFLMLGLLGLMFRRRRSVR